MAGVRRKRFALCGLSDRGISMFTLPMLGASEFLDAGDDLSDLTELVAVLDIDQVRMDRFNERTGATVPTYGPADFDAMIADHRPDAVIVASPDATAMHALITEPSWPGDSMPPDHQPSSSRSASCTSTTPAPEKPGGTAIGPG